MADTPTDNNFTFTPIHPFNMEEPKTWAATIGQLNWDNDKIVFSKRSLLEFLKTCQVTVNTNFTEIQKLYASFGRLSKAATDAAVADLIEAEIADPSHDERRPSGGNGNGSGNGNAGSSGSGSEHRPTRKVIDPPGGKQSLKLYGEEYEEADALSLAPPADGGPGVDVDIDRMQHLKLHVEPEADGGAKIEDIPDDKAAAAAAAAAPTGAEKQQERASNPPPNFRPTRKVRQVPGGATQLGAAFFGGYEDETEQDREAARAPTGGKKAGNQQSSGGLW